MTLYQTTDEQKVHVYKIAARMSDTGLPASFVARAVEVASVSEGVYELMALWQNFENVPDEREQVIADIQDAIDENDDQPPRVVQKPKVSFEHLDDVAKRIVHFKAELRKKVDKWGGISKLAEATGMPQPSLSRFFATASMPRRTTLYKIAAALDLSEEEIVFEWTS